MHYGEGDLRTSMGSDQQHVPAQPPEQAATGASGVRSRDGHVGVPHAATSNTAPVAPPTLEDNFTNRNTVQCQWDEPPPQCEARAPRRHPYWATRWHRGRQLPKVAEYYCDKHTRLAVLRDIERDKRMTFGARRLGLEP